MKDQQDLLKSSSVIFEIGQCMVKLFLHTMQALKGTCSKSHSVQRVFLQGVKNTERQ